MKTWHFENAVVILVLGIVWFVTGCKPVELLGSAAVFAGFVCGSISDRMVEREAARDRPSVACFRLFWWFYVAKEVGWAAYFTIQGSWSALVGCALFAVYPLWRKVWRRVHPLKIEAES